MPSAKILEQKKAVVAGLTEKLNAACAGVIVDYKGINVEDDTNLRRELRQAGVDYFVVKNTLLRFAAKEAGLTDMESVLEGTTAVALSNEDYVASARILSKYANSKDKYFEIKTGFIDGKIIPLDEIAQLAKLPTREVLLATVAGTFNAPIAAFARAIQAVVDSKSEGEEASA